MSSPRFWLSVIAIAGAAALLAACGEAEPRATEAPLEDEAPKPEVPKESQTMVLAVTGMTCGHCEESIRREVKFCAGVEKISANHETGKVVVEGVNVDEDEVRTTIEKLGFTVLVSTTTSEAPVEANPSDTEKP